MLEEHLNLEKPEAVIERAQRSVKKHIKKQKVFKSITLHLTILRHCVAIYRALKSIENGALLRLDLKKQRFDILKT